MKKIILMLSVLILAVSYSFGQASGTGEMGSKTLAANATYHDFTVPAAYYLGGKAGYDTLNYYILSNKNTPVRAIAYVDVKARVGTTDTYSFDLQAKNFTEESFASVYKGEGKGDDFALADTTLFSEIEVGEFYRYWQVQLATDNSCAESDSITFSNITFKLIEY